jgi:hypothetical protein
VIGAQPPLNGLQSEYALDYPVQNLHASWTVALRGALIVTNSVAITKPYQQPGIPAWNPNPYRCVECSFGAQCGETSPLSSAGKSQ